LNTCAWVGGDAKERSDRSERREAEELFVVAARASEELLDVERRR
jgi:hypothetical protein